jgi:hypothetical protein
MEVSGFGSVGGRPLHGEVGDLLGELDIDDVSFKPEALEAWLSVVRRGAELTDDRFDPLFDALRESRLVVVDPPRDVPHPDIDLRLALAAGVARAEPVRSLLDEIGCDTNVACPVVVLPYGPSLPWLGALPSPIWAPTEPERVEAALLDAIVPCVAHLTLLHRSPQFADEEPDPKDDEPDPEDEEPDLEDPTAIATAALRAAQDALRDEPDPDDEEPNQEVFSAKAGDWNRLLDEPLGPFPSATTVPAFAAVCRLAQMVANDVLPDFVSREYWISIDLNRISDWMHHSPIEIVIVSAGEFRDFALGHAAEGLQLWLQLAILEAIAALNDLTATATALMQGAWLPEPEHVERSELNLMRDRLSALFACTGPGGDFDVDSAFREAALDILSRPYLGDARSRWNGSQLFVDRIHCYLLDEPERHLHPAVARKAARWLRGVMAARRAQCVLTTHSVPFLDLGDDASYNYLWRQGPKVFSTQFRRHELDEFRLLTEEMGFDRGELLTTIQQILFVEGRADQIVLETLFGRDLRRLGVAVVPIHGVGRLHRVVEAEVLFRYTSARIRVLVDNDVADFVPALRNDPDALEAALRQKKNTELQALAQLLRTAAQAERDAELEVLSIPVPDMFFLLDDRIITELYREYPGHGQAESDWMEMRERSGQQIGRKRFRSERYGVPDDGGLYSNVATLMRERNIFPRPLADVFDRLAEWSD